MGGPLPSRGRWRHTLVVALTLLCCPAAHGAQMSCPLLLELVELPTELHTGMTQLAATYTRRVFLRRVPLDLTHPPHAEEADSGRGAAVAALDGVDGLVMAEEGGACGLDVAGDVLDAAEPGSQVELVGGGTLEERSAPLVPPRDAGDANTVRVKFEQGHDGGADDERWVRGRWVPHANAFVVTYARGRIADAFYAVGQLMSSTHDPPPSDDVSVPTCMRPPDFHHRTPFTMVGMMVDVSRGRVPTVAAHRRTAMFAALTGYSHLLLYMEDTYEVAGQPLMGHGRGRYTPGELRAIDSAAAEWGLEVVACIQTLGHMEQLLQWAPYAPLRDSRSRLKMNHKATMELLRKMVEVVATNLRSRRIHLGLDEPFGVESTPERQRLSAERRVALRQHLHRLVTMCHSHGLRPMAYSDPLFRQSSASNDYYDEAVPPLAWTDVKELPQGLDLVYWDYYHTEAAAYERMISKHAAALVDRKPAAGEGGSKNSTQRGRELVVATGGWTWSRFWAALPMAFETTGAAMQAAKRQGVRQVYTTLWMDDGAEVEPRSATPVLTYLAAHAWARVGTPDHELRHTAATVAAAVAWVDSEVYTIASGMDVVPGVDPRTATTNIAKWLLWDDPLLQPLSPMVDAVNMTGYYRELSTWLSDRVRVSTDPTTGFTRDMAVDFARRTTLAVGLKLEWQQRVRAAYHAQDKGAMKLLVGVSIQEVQAAVHSLWKLHRSRWLESYKPFGLEVLEMRYGTLRIRLETARDRLKAWAVDETGTITIDELEEERINPYPHLGLNSLPTLCWGRAATTSTPSICHDSLCPLI